MLEYLMSLNLFIPNLHSWYTTMKGQDSWHLITFFHYDFTKSTTVIPLLSLTHSFAHSGPSGPYTGVTGTKGGCLHKPLSHSHNKVNQQLIFQTWHDHQSCVLLAYIPFDRGTGYFHWSSLTLIDTSSRAHKRMF